MLLKLFGLALLIAGGAIALVFLCVLILGIVGLIFLLLAHLAVLIVLAYAGYRLLMRDGDIVY